MAKNAVKVRDLKRRKLVERYAAKRKELKANGYNESKIFA